jgi:hypothetical protein
MAKRKNLAADIGFRPLTRAEQKQYGKARGYVPIGKKVTAKTIGDLFQPRRRIEERILGKTFEAHVNPYQTSYSNRYEWALSNFMATNGFNPRRKRGVKFHASRAAQQDPQWQEAWKALRSKAQRRKSSAKGVHTSREPYIKALIVLGLRDPDWTERVGDSPTTREGAIKE